MQLSRTLLGSAGLLGLAITASVSGTSPEADEARSLPAAPLVDFAQTQATSLNDYFGQAVLLEFFAYW